MDELLTKMDEQMEVRGLAARTRESYLRSVRKFGEHFGRCPGELDLGHAERTVSAMPSVPRGRR